MDELRIQDQINRLVLNDEIIRSGGDIKDHVGYSEWLPGVCFPY